MTQSLPGFAPRGNPAFQSPTNREPRTENREPRTENREHVGQISGCLLAQHFKSLCIPSNFPSLLNMSEYSRLSGPEAPRLTGSSSAVRFRLFRATKSLEALLSSPRGAAAFSEAFALIPHYTARPLEAHFQPQQRTGEIQGALLQFLQRLAELLEAISGSFRAPRSSWGRASSFSSVSRSSWGRPPAPPASRKAPGGDLQLLQSTAKLLEARLQTLRERPLGSKNRLQQRRDHIQELEATRSCRHKAVVSLHKAALSPCLPKHHALASAATPFHETNFLGFR